MGLDPLDRKYSAFGWKVVGVSGGLAIGGAVPFVSTASCFLTAPALEQVKRDTVYAGFNVKMISESSRVAYCILGPTHHSIEILAWLRPLNSLTVITPSGPRDMAAAQLTALALPVPVEKPGFPGFVPTGSVE